MVNPVYQFSPRFSHIVLSGTSAALLCETDTFIVYGALPVRLLALLDRPRKEDEIIEALTPEFKLASVFFELNRLHDGGFLETGGSAAAKRPLTAANAMPSRKNAFSEIVDLGTEPSAGPLLQHYLAALVPLPLRIVIIDDYLDPQLAEFATSRSHGQSWLPVKAVGRVPWFGPRFGHDGDPCFGCLISRLRRNHSLEAWHLDHSTSGQPLRLSRERSEASLSATFKLLAAEIGKTGTGPAAAAFSGHLVTVDLATAALRCHRVDNDSQCQTCAPRRARPDSGPPLTLTSRPRQLSRENGLRIRDSAEAMASLEPLISPHTGIVQRVAPLAGVPPEFGYPHLAHFSVPIDAGFFDRKRALVPTGGNGKGFTKLQGRLSAVAEAIERTSAYYRGDEPVVQACYAEVAGEAVPPHRIYGCDETDYLEWAATRPPDPVFGPGNFAPDMKLTWTPAWSLTHRAKRLVPRSFVYFSIPPEDGTNYADAATNGLASGGCLEEALLHGFLEVIERDAATIWWCNQIPRPALDLDSFSLPQMQPLGAYLDRHGWDFYALDLTHDFNVPVVVAVARHRTNPSEIPRMGFGADLDPGIALNRAVTELGQSWYWTPHFRLHDFCLQYDPEPLWAKPFVAPANAPRRTASDFPRQETGNLKDDIELLVARGAALGLEVVAIDLTRPGHGLVVTRVIVPGLCRFWPRFATARLFDLPVRAGWLPAPRLAAEQSRIPFFYSNCGIRLDDWRSR